MVLPVLARHTTGMTSHAAVVARGMGKCCVAGCHEISVDTHQGNFTADGKVSRRPEPRGLCSLTPAQKGSETVPLDFMVDSVVLRPCWSCSVGCR